MAAKRTITKKTKVYGSFRGVDFSVDASLVDDYRSPYAPNLVSDVGGMPEKRLGWRTLMTITDGDAAQTINGLYYGDIGGSRVKLVHAGAKLYSFTDADKTLIYSGLANARSTGFFMGGKFYILDGTNYVCYDGTTAADVCANAYVPVIVVSRDPVPTQNSGGTLLEAPNLLSGKKTAKFLGNSTDLTYYLPQNTVESVDKVESMNSSGTMVTLTAGTDYSANLTNGTVTFTAAKAPPMSGIDNIYITYTKTTAGYADRIKKSTIATLYGVGGSNRVFVAGNPDYKAQDFYSELWHPDYFPDTGYSVVGDDNTAIMGYQKLGKYLVIVKEDGAQDATIFQRWGELDSSGRVYFPLEQGLAGTGAISKHCFMSLVDEPLFLSGSGIMATTTTNILAERTIKNRSFYIDYALSRESGLDGACAVVWNGLYILAVNGKAFVLDSRNKSFRNNKSNDGSDYVYECYHWTNIPARVFLKVGDALYFGTSDGRICKFNSDIDNKTRWNDDVTPVSCCWSTKNDDDGASYLLKSMQKKGCTVTIKPYTRSSAKIYYSKDGNPEVLIRRHLMDILDFNDIDFERFSFNTNDSPQDVYLKKKVKKYKRLQIIVKNDGLNEGFGIFQIAKTFSVGNYAKK